MFLSCFSLENCYLFQNWIWFKRVEFFCRHVHCSLFTMIQLLKSIFCWNYFCLATNFLWVRVLGATFVIDKIIDKLNSVEKNGNELRRMQTINSILKRIWIEWNASPVGFKPNGNMYNKSDDIYLCQRIFNHQHADKSFVQQTDLTYYGIYSCWCDRNLSV